LRRQQLARIGELVRELDTAQRARTDLRPNGETQTKERAIEEAGCLFLEPGDIRTGGEGVRWRG
jgi:hypothetical protein